MTRAALLAAVALIAVPGGAAAKEQPKPRFGGTVVIGAVGEPASLNPILSGHTWPHMLAHANAFKVAPDFTYRSSLVSHGRVDERNPTVVTLHIRRDARWSDGRPVVATDFITLCRVITTHGVGIWNGHPCSFARLRALDAKRVRVTFDRSFPSWRAWFAGLPTHALEGLDFRTVWLSDLDNPKTGRPIGSGPFLLESWRRGHSMTFIRNERYFGKRPYLDRLVVRFLPDAQSVVAALQRGEVDAAWGIALPVAELRRDRGVVVRSTSGSFWELLTLNLGHRGGGHPALRRRFVREAIARGVDRLGLVRTLWREEAPKLQVLQSVFLLRQHPQYRAWWTKYRYEPVRARRILERNGCTRGAGGIYVCQGQRLSFRLGTTAGNASRQLAEEVIKRSLASVGIEVRIDNAPSGLFFSRLEAGDYDIGLYGYFADSLELTDVYDVYGCPTKNSLQRNQQGYCNSNVDRLLRAVAAEHDGRKRFEFLNRALALVANDLPTLPLYQRPSFVVHSTALRGLRDNTALAKGPLWNVEWWWKERAR